MPIEGFFHSRYIKIAQTMSEIDQVTNVMCNIVEQSDMFDEIKDKITELAVMAKLACETIRTDPAIFDVWPRYIAAKEEYEENINKLSYEINNKKNLQSLEACNLIKEGGIILIKLATLRVPIPDSVRAFTQRCNDVVA